MTPLRTPRRFVSLRTKLLLGTFLVIAVLMLAVTGLVGRRQRTAIIEEVERREMVLAHNLAAISTGPLLLYHFTALEQIVARIDAENDDVVYAVVLDRAGQVAAHSRQPELVGAPLDDPISVRALAQAPIIQPGVGPGGEALYDFAVPVLVEGQRWGTARIGLSRRRMEAQIFATRRELALVAGAALLVGGLATALLARRIARPVRQLADGVAAVARGDLDQRIELVTSDEIGRLALAFNEMARQLGQQRAELTAADAALRQRFAELSDLKSYTDHILSSLGTGIITLDLDGRVVMLNPAAGALAGVLVGGARGRACTEVFGHFAELRDLLLETLRTRIGVPAVPLSLVRQGAPPVPIEATVSPLRGAEGHSLGVVAVLRDLTPVRQLEEQLRRSDRLAALGTLAAGLAHEIKNPLTAIMTFSRHVARRYADERFRQRFQSVVPRELERINAIVDGLLRLARPTRLALVPVHLTELTDQALELHADSIEARHVRVAREYAVGLPPVPADAEHLYQALVNLVGNAVDAMEPGGTLTVRVRPEDGAGGLMAGGRPADRLAVEIEDTGSGIRPEYASNVFNPFFTTKSGGTGLGLAITHKIVEDHGGAVTFRTQPGRGTTFVIVLPILPERRVERSIGSEGRLGTQNLVISSAPSRGLRLAVVRWPDPQNRVTPAMDRLDPLGIPRPRIHFRFDPYALVGLAEARRLQDQIMAELSATEITQQGPIADSAVMGGTARMGADPRASVVDAELRAHDHPNLFVVGSAAFPTPRPRNNWAGTASSRRAAARRRCRSLIAIRWCGRATLSRCEPSGRDRRRSRVTRTCTGDEAAVVTASPEPACRTSAP